MNIPTQAEFVQQIDEFLARHDMKPSRLAREATGEPGLIDAIRAGKRSPTLATVEKLSEYMSRKDIEAKLKAAALAPISPAEEADEELPFSVAPVNPTGASSPTSSSTTGQPTTPKASASCPVCSTPADTADQSSPSCSAADRESEAAK